MLILFGRCLGRRPYSPLSSHWQSLKKDLFYLASLVTTVIHFQISSTSSMVRLFHEPLVSIETGKKMQVFDSSQSLDVLCCRLVGFGFWLQCYVLYVLPLGWLQLLTSVLCHVCVAVWLAVALDSSAVSCMCCCLVGCSSGLQRCVMYVLLFGWL